MSTCFRWELIKQKTLWKYNNYKCQLSSGENYLSKKIIYQFFKIRDVYIPYNKFYYKILTSWRV